jgi:hypothetical protein
MLVPKVRQRVTVVGIPGTFLVLKVNRHRESADLVALDEVFRKALLKDMPFADLLPIEATQSPPDVSVSDPIPKA